MAAWASEGRASLQVSDRTKTAEELAELERLRLEALEKQRLKRMTAAASGENGDADEPDAEPAQATGGYAARRQKRRKLSSEAEAEFGPSGKHSCALLIKCQRQAASYVASGIAFP